MSTAETAEIEKAIEQGGARTQLESAELHKKDKLGRLEAARMYEQKIKNAKNFFHDEFPVGLTNDSYVLIAARTGSGKTTFAKQAAAYALNAGQKVGIFSNEMSAASYDHGIYRLMGHGLHTEEEKTEHWLGYSDSLFVYDGKSSDDRLNCWDAAFKFIDDENTKHKFDLIIFDQISNLNSVKDSENLKKHKHTFEQMNFFSSQIKTRINTGADDFPPIIVFQQSMRLDSSKNVADVDLKTLLRGSKSILDDCTLSFYLDLRSEGSSGDAPPLTYLVLDKNRYDLPFREGKAKVTKWIMSNRWLVPHKITSKNGMVKLTEVLPF